jgi:sulfoacetaldehyde acetyltransferase
MPTMLLGAIIPMCANGITVDQSGEVRNVLCEAISSKREPVIEIMLTQDLSEPFRRDALSKLVRLLDKYKSYTGK